MIKAQELRIGNYFKPIKESQDDFAEVVEIHVESFYCEDSAGIIFISTNDEVEPIPLTQEWLLNFGLNKVTSNSKEWSNFDNYNSNLNGVSVLIEISAGRFYLVSDNGNRLSIELEYVHQLQNLYFASTGEELTIKDNVKLKLGVTVRNRLTIGENVVVGMGGVVVKSVDDNSIVYGNPAE